MNAGHHQCLHYLFKKKKVVIFEIVCERSHMQDTHAFIHAVDFVQVVHRLAILQYALYNMTFRFKRYYIDAAPSHSAW